ncbi:MULTISPECIES: hypothetical protein [Kribbella]|nr:MULTISPECIES: hypothetical protein [Kribbella]
MRQAEGEDPGVTTPPSADGEFAFEVHDVFHLGQDHAGEATLVGPVTRSASSSLALGDTLEVPTEDGETRQVQCVEFPLVNLGRDRAEWVRVSVAGLGADRVRIGGTAAKFA